MIYIVGVLIILLLLSFIGHIVIQKREDRTPIPQRHVEPVPSCKTNCQTTLHGCCLNSSTPKMDILGSNCVHPDIHANPYHIGCDDCDQNGQNRESQNRENQNRENQNRENQNRENQSNNGHVEPHDQTKGNMYSLTGTVNIVKQ